MSLKITGSVNGPCAFAQAISDSGGSMKFSDLALVTCAVFSSYVEPGTSECRRFTKEWKADKTVAVRSFKRIVRAGGTWSPVTMVVVRRKP